jgi:hypothetical protein
MREGRIDAYRKGEMEDKHKECGAGRGKRLKKGDLKKGRDKD